MSSTQKQELQLLKIDGHKVICNVCKYSSTKYEEYMEHFFKTKHQPNFHKGSTVLPSDICRTCPQGGIYNDANPCRAMVPIVNYIKKMFKRNNIKIIHQKTTEVQNFNFFWGQEREVQPVFRKEVIVIEPKPELLRDDINDEKDKESSENDNEKNKEGANKHAIESKILREQEKKKEKQQERNKSFNQLSQVARNASIQSPSQDYPNLASIVKQKVTSNTGYMELTRSSGSTTPLISRPATSKPMTSGTTTSGPTTSEPITKRPTTSEPINKRPTTSRSTTSRPIIVQPIPDHKKNKSVSQPSTCSALPLQQLSGSPEEERVNTITENRLQKKVVKPKESGKRIGEISDELLKKVKQEQSQEPFRVQAKSDEDDNSEANEESDSSFKCSVCDVIIKNQSAVRDHFYFNHNVHSGFSKLILKMKSSKSTHSENGSNKITDFSEIVEKNETEILNRGKQNCFVVEQTLTSENISKSKEGHKNLSPKNNRESNKSHKRPSTEKISESNESHKRSVTECTNKSTESHIRVSSEKIKESDESPKRSDTESIEKSNESPKNMIEPNGSHERPRNVNTNEIIKKPEKLSSGKKDRETNTSKETSEMIKNVESSSIKSPQMLQNFLKDKNIISFGQDKVAEVVILSDNQVRCRHCDIILSDYISLKKHLQEHFSKKALQLQSGSEYNKY